MTREETSLFGYKIADLPTKMPQEHIYSIYALRDPRNDEIRYVGLSAKPRRRLTAIKKTDSPANACNPRRNDWIRDLQKQGLQPCLDILKTGLLLEEAQDLEACWIHRYWKMGMPLTNVVGVKTAHARNLAFQVVGSKLMQVRSLAMSEG